MRITALKKKVDADLIFLYSLGMEYNPNIYYLTGYKGAGFFCLPKNGGPFFVVPRMEEEKARKTGLEVYVGEKSKRLFEVFRDVVEKKRISVKKTGIDKDNFNLLVFERLKKILKGRYLDISKECRKIRMIKDNSEISAIKKACKITDTVFSTLVSDFRFKTEKQVKIFIERKIKDAGCDLAFPPIVASGKGSSNPHYDGDARLKKGFLLLDFGAKYDGYCSDMSRTIYLGNPKTEEVKDYDLVLGSYFAAFNGADVKIPFSKLYEYSYAHFGEKAKNFTHALGHGLGLQIHEAPNLSPEETEKIVQGVAFTIEPGLYFPEKYGIRIEDTVLFDKKLVALTKSKKKLVMIK